MKIYHFQQAILNQILLTCKRFVSSKYYLLKTTNFLGINFILIKFCICRCVKKIYKVV